MDDQESGAIYDRLLAALRRVGLEWVADQVVQEVRVGKTIQREVETFKGNRLPADSLDPNSREYSPQFRRGPKATFPVTEEYRPSERLRLVLDAIERAVVNTADMEHEVLERLGSTLGIIEGISFSVEEDAGESIQLDSQRSASRIEAGRKLSRLIDELRGEI